VLNGRISSGADVAYSLRARSDEPSEQLPKEMSDAHVASGETGQPQSGAPAMYRLVIRAEIIPEEAPQTFQSHSNRRALALIVGVVAALILLSWLAIVVLRTDSPSPTAAHDEAQDEPRLQATAPARAEAAPAASANLQQRATSTAVRTPAAVPPGDTRSIAAKSIEPALPTDRSASPSPINEVVPVAARSALQTIRGTIRVTVQVTIDKQGTVVAATSDDPGPSRYFERLSLEASRKWTFAPSETADERRARLQFSFTRDGATARTSPLP
jgi:TonB family protein